MHEPEFPSAEQVRRELAPILSMVSGWFETATSRARASLERDGLPFDGGLFAYNVRAQMKQLLEAATKSDVVDADGGAIELTHASMLGLHFRFAKYDIRAYKAPAGGYPMPGGSEARKRFFCQLSPIQPELFDENDFDAEKARPDKANIAFLWSVDGRGELCELRMILPNGWNATTLRRVWEMHIDLASALEGDASAWSIQTRAQDNEDDLGLERDDEGLPKLDEIKPEDADLEE